MSFNSTHMAKDNHVDGIRVMVIVASYIEAFKNITWDNMAERFIGTQSYGNTKFTDAELTAHWFKSHFNLLKTTKSIGYSNTCGCATRAVCQRLSRLNTINIYKVYVGLLINGLLDYDHIAPVLNKDLVSIGFRKGVATQMYKAKYFRYFCKQLVIDALDTMLPKEDEPQGKTKVRQAAERLCVPLATIRYWRDLKVKDIMIKR